MTNNEIIKAFRAEVINEFADEVLNAISFTPIRGSFDYAMGYEDALHKAIEIVKINIKEMVGDTDDL